MIQVRNTSIWTVDMKDKENKLWPHRNEEWVHKDGSGLVIIDAMFENETFYTRMEHKWTCETEEFKRNYMKR